MKKKYIAKACYTSYVYLEIEAENEAEAREIAEASDGGEWSEEQGWDAWDIYSIKEKED